MKVYKLKFDRASIINHEGAFTNQWTFVEVGDYLNKSSNYNDSDMLQPLINKLSLNKWDSDHFIDHVNTVYRLPNLTLSRDKLALFQERCNFNVVRDKDKADVIICSKKYIDKLVHREWGSYSTVKNAVEAFQEGYKIYNVNKNNHLSILINQLQQLDPADTVQVDAGWGRFDEDLQTYDALTDWFDRLDRIQGNRSYVATIKKSDHDWLVNNSHKIMMDEEVNKLCTEDSVALTKEDFGRIQEIIKSGDTENISVGLTLMANCNIKESNTYLALLFAFHSEEMKMSKVWNTVNFKYLRKIFQRYIDITLSNWGAAYDNLITYMIKENMLTLWASRQIANAMFVRVIQGHYGVGTDRSPFVISEKSLELKPEIAAKLVKDESENISEYVGTGGHNDDLGSHPNDLPF